jgi:hypothetical protein
MDEGEAFQQQKKNGLFDFESASAGDHPNFYFT